MSRPFHGSSLKTNPPVHQPPTRQSLPTTSKNMDLRSKMGEVAAWCPTYKTLFMYINDQEEAKGYPLKTTSRKGKITFDAEEEDGPIRGTPARRYIGCEKSDCRGEHVNAPQKRRSQGAKPIDCQFQAVGTFYARRAQQGLPAWGLRITQPTHSADCLSALVPGTSNASRKTARWRIGDVWKLDDRVETIANSQTVLNRRVIAERLAAESGIPVNREDVQTAMKRLKKKQGAEGEDRAAKRSKVDHPIPSPSANPPVQQSPSSLALPTMNRANFTSKIGDVTAWFPTYKTLFMHINDQEEAKGYPLKTTSRKGRINCDADEEDGPIRGTSARRYIGCERDLRYDNDKALQKRMSRVDTNIYCQYQAVGTFYARRAQQGLPAWGLRIEQPAHSANCLPTLVPGASNASRRTARWRIGDVWKLEDHVQKYANEAGMTRRIIAERLAEESGIQISSDDVRSVIKRLGKKKGAEGEERGARGAEVAQVAYPISSPNPNPALHQRDPPGEDSSSNRSQVGHIACPIPPLSPNPPVHEPPIRPTAPVVTKANFTSKIGQVTAWFPTYKTLFMYLNDQHESKGYPLKTTSRKGDINFDGEDEDGPIRGTPARRYIGCEKDLRYTDSSQPRKPKAQVTYCQYQAVGAFYAKRARDGLLPWGLRVPQPAHSVECLPALVPGASNASRRTARWRIEYVWKLDERIEMYVNAEVGLNRRDIAERLAEESGIQVNSEDVQSAIRRLRKKQGR